MFYFLCLVKVAQYIHFPMPVLQAFIVKFNEEEERELQKIKDRLGEKSMQFTALSFTFASSESR